MVNIHEYLANDAERIHITQQHIDEYREAHEGRKKWGRSRHGYSMVGIHPHENNPYCKVCDEEYQVGDEVYKFYVGRGYLIYYHIDCFNSANSNRQRSILYQDRAVRSRPVPVAVKREETEFEKFIRLLRKQHGHGVKIG